MLIAHHCRPNPCSITFPRVRCKGPACSFVKTIRKRGPTRPTGGRPVTSRALDVPDELELSRGRFCRRAWGGLQGRLRRTVGAALVLAWLASAGPASADTIFSDGFESGDFSAWSQTVTAG